MAEVHIRLDGIDIYHGNNMPPWSEVLAEGITFVWHKASERNFGDTMLGRRWSDLKAAGIIRGAYHFYFNDHSPSVQASTLIGKVKRLLPGDLAPSLDFEHSSEVIAWSPDKWLEPLQEFLDQVEVGLGRSPFIYTSATTWHDLLNNSASFNRFGDYPLWVKQYFNTDRFENRLTRNPSLPAAWRDWAFWQYTDETPVEFPSLRRASSKIDFNVSSGSIYKVRGLADLGRTAPYSSSPSGSVVYGEPDGHLHLLTFVGFWLDRDLTGAMAAPPAAGDPAACAMGDREFIVYRADDGHIYLLSHDPSSGSQEWVPQDLTSAVGGDAAVGDPGMIVNGPELHIVYWGDDNHHYHLWWDGSWRITDMTNESGGAEASGNPATYKVVNVVHTVARAGASGHLHDIWFESGSWHEVDLTQSASVPSATYRPTAYATPFMAPRIVFRAVRGEIYEIARDTLATANLSHEAGGAPTAAGSPDAFVIDNAPHIVYRTVDGDIYEIYWDGANWRFRNAGCTKIAAADPSANTVSNVGHVTFRGVDGYIYQATLDSGGWQCETIIPLVT